MDISFFSIFKIFGAVSAWAQKSFDDGKVTIREAVELAEIIAEVLGVPLEIDFTPDEPEETEEGPPGPDG